MEYLGAVLNEFYNDYLIIFTQITANSIKYKGVIGVDFAITFIKSLFKEPITFDDLENIFDIKMFNNYKSMIYV